MGKELLRQDSNQEISILRKGLRYAVTLKCLQVTDIIIVTESACRSFASGDAQELWAKAINILN